jgi:hypothetical protein
MSFVYYSVLSTQGLPLIAAQTHLAAPWSTPAALSALLNVLSTLDFADYTSRRFAIRRIRTAIIQPFAYTYPFDPTAFPLLPPRTQVRFPSNSVFTFLPPTFLPIFQRLQSALAYRDSDGPIDPSLTLYTASLAQFTTALTSAVDQFDRLSWELAHFLEWLPYPPVALPDQ